MSKCDVSTVKMHCSVNKVLLHCVYSTFHNNAAFTFVFSKCVSTTNVAVETSN